jgi:uncharacterized protein
MMNMNARTQTVKPLRRLPSGRIPRAAIRRYVNGIVERFQPKKVILFGSYANGSPNADSDVDLLVVMPAKNEVSQAVRIRHALPAPFPLDLLVRSPKTLSRRKALGDWFMKEITEQGIVLHDSTVA